MNARKGVLFLILGGLAFGSMGCAVADTGAFARLQDEVVALQREVATLKKAAPAASPGAGGADVQALRRTMADMGSESDRLKSDLLAANSRQEDARVEMQRLADRQAELERSMQEVRKSADRMKELDQRVTALEEKAPKASSGPAAVPAILPGDSPSAWRSPEEMYEFAVGQVKGGNPKKGREILTAFVAQYPGHRLIPNALYWKGESYYAEKDYENAILSFQDVVDKYPSGDKSPDAVYKQGLSFLGLNDPKNARILFDLVVSKYPRSPAADLARKKLAEFR